MGGKHREDEPIGMSNFTPMNFDGAKLWVPCDLDGKKRRLWLTPDDARIAIGFAFPLVMNAQNVVSYAKYALRRGGGENRKHG